MKHTPALRNILCLLWICVFLPLGSARAQDILATVAPNSNGSDTYVDIPNPTGGNLYFFTDPAPSAARMARVAGGSEFPWPSFGNFAPDPNFSFNRLQNGNYLRVYPKTLPAGTEIEAEFSYTQLGPRYHFRVSVVAGARIDSISFLDPLQSTTSLVHWGVTFDQPISDVTAANFALDPTIPGAAVISVTPNTAQPSANWTVTASTGTTMGSIGLKWVGHRTETPSVPNMYTTQFSYLFGDSIVFSQDLPIPPIFVLPNTTTTLTVVAHRRSGQELFYRWYVTAPGNTTPVAIAGATSSSYTPPAHASGTYTYFCSVFGSPGQEFTNFLHSQTATITIRMAPTVNSPFFNSVTSSSAHLGGQIEADNGFAITRRGVLYAPTLVNPNPTLGGTGVIENDDEANSVGGFTRTVTGLSAATNYSFVVFAVNSQGTNYSQVLTFQTNPPVGSGSLIVSTIVDEDNGTSDSGVGAGTSLREAVAYANALGGNQTITFSPNLTAQGPASIQLTESLGTITLANLSGTTTIAGPGANLLTIQGANSNRIFLATEAGGSARLNGLTLSNASDINRDGGVIQNGGILYANDCVFSNNSAYRGGAIYNGGTSYLSRCTFADNSAAAAANLGGGGAISNEGIVWAMNCTFSGNSASAGGAIYNVFNSSRVYLICSTLGGNSASTAGGGVFMTAGPTITANNSIISGNTAPSGANVSATLFQTNSLIDADPAAIFTTGLLANNGGTTPTIALKPGGLAVNAGTNSLAVDYSSAPLATDSRGKPRIINGTVDLGAYEMPALPALGASTATNITATSAILGGNVTSDGYGNISQRGVLYALTWQNSNPTIGAPGVAEVDASGTTGNFTVPVNGLTALAGYSFTGFVTNEAGTVYAPVQTFQTTESSTLVVTTSTDVVNEMDGLTNLREAVQYANSLSGPQTITFAPALAGQTLAVTQGELVVTGNVTFDGSAVAGLTISGNGSTRILRISPGGIAIVKSLTLANGSSSAHGGAIYHSGASLTLQNSTFCNNQAVSSAYGGAISADSGSLSITGCTFSNNQSTEGNGGAIVNFGTQLTIINSTFSGNGALNGGAILSYANTTTLTNCSIVNNSASFTGGGVERVGRTGNTISLQNTLVAANTAPLFGPDVASYNNQNNGALTTLGHNLIGNGAGSIGLTNGNNGDQVGAGAAPINANVGLLQDNGGPTQTVALLPGSPAFDAGVAIAGLTTDQRGTARPQGAAVDIGAFELVPSQAAAIPIIGPLGGTYQDSVQVSITSTSAGTAVRYTLDGSTPSTTNGLLYTAPFNVTQTAMVKAIAYNGGWLPSPIASVSFTVLTPLAYWRNLQSLPADGSQDLANPSGDGVANLLKYAFNMAPNAGDLAKPNITVLQENGTAGLPYIEVDAQGRLTIEFVRRKASTNPGINYIVETGADLPNLNALDLSTASVTSIDSIWERVAVIDPTASAKRFGRVRLMY